MGRRREKEDKKEKKDVLFWRGLFLFAWSVLLFVGWLVLKNL